ncbi:Acetyltransferase [Gillisia hiemivivida]
MRVFLYKWLLKYNVGSNVKIGRSLINCNSVTLGNNVIIRHNNIISCDSFSVGSNTKIHSGNNIFGKSSFSIGENSRIINDHFIDLWNNITIGNNIWIAGRGSQFWTHGSIHTKKGTKDLGINIKVNVYISSNTSIAPGVTIENDNLIGLGSVVSKSILTKGNIVAGN